MSIYTSDFKLVKAVRAGGQEQNFSLQECVDGIYYLVYNSAGKQKITKIAKACKEQ